MADTRDEARARWENDKKRVAIVEAFITKYHIYEEMGIMPTERNSDDATQKLGKDLELTVGNKTYIVDEKMATSYANKGLNTFCQEILRKNSKDTRHSKGWLVMDESITEAYSFVWVDRTFKGEPKEDFSSIRDLYEIHVAVVTKESLMRYLKNRGYDKDKLVTKAWEMLRHGETRVVDGNLEFRHSSNFRESPVNVLVSRSALDKMSIAHASFVRDGEFVHIVKDRDTTI